VWRSGGRKKRRGGELGHREIRVSSGGGPTKQLFWWWLTVSGGGALEEEGGECDREIAENLEGAGQTKIRQIIALTNHW